MHNNKFSVISIELLTRRDNRFVSRVVERDVEGEMHLAKGKDWDGDVVFVSNGYDEIAQAIQQSVDWINEHFPGRLWKIENDIESLKREYATSIDRAHDRERLSYRVIKCHVPKR